MSEAELLAALALQENAVLDVIDRGLFREVDRTGFDRVVLGLSGGLDSALTAYLAVRAFGVDKVIALAMPYRTSNPDSLAHAELVAGELGVELRTIDISEQIDAYFARFPEAGENRRGNKMARERMTILYDVSAAEHAMVLGTSNKTEILLGYSTLYGDSASAVNPIGDLYKTQVRQLARYLGVPQVVIDKPPSADLWQGQTDEDELGFTYERVDTLLAHMVDRRYRPVHLRELGFDDLFIGRVRSLVRTNQYKRKLPVIIKLSGRTVDKDFLYPAGLDGMSALSLVATPIGNLSDVSDRARAVLAAADVVYAEDTRHSGRLLEHLGVDTRLRSCHDHNEGQRAAEIVDDLRAGRSVALISDAGTPGIADPGHVVARSVIGAGFDVTMVPGPSAVIMAVVLSGFATDRFVFDGWLPRRSGGLRRRIEELATEPRTVVVLRVQSPVAEVAAGLRRGGRRPAPGRLPRADQASRGGPPGDGARTARALW